MDEFTELYDNLSPNKLSIENVTQLETKVEVLEREVKHLEAALNRSELEKRDLNINFERDKKIILNNHESLLANVSALFKTAKKEIERKNNTIKELRQQLDDLVFRRNQRRWPPQNETVEYQNADDAKAVPEDRPIASVIRPTARNHVCSDREKSSSSDKSPVPVQLAAKQNEYAEKDKRVHSSRDKSFENTAHDYRLKDFNKFKYSHSTSPECVLDEFSNSKNSTDSYPYRRSDRKNRGADDPEYRIHRKVKEKHRYSPYKHRKEDYERSRHKYSRQERDHGDDEYSKSRIRRSPHDRGRHEFGDGNRAADMRQEVERASHKFHENRSDYSSRGANDDSRREAEFSARKSIEDRRREDPAYQKLIDNRRRQSPGDFEVAARKPNEDRQREDLTPSEPNIRRSVENRRKDYVAPRKFVDDRMHETPADFKFDGRGMIEDQRREDSAYAKSCTQKSIENRRKQDVGCEKLMKDRRESPAALEFGDRNSVDMRRRVDSLFADSRASKCLVDQSEEDMAQRKSIHKRESPANLESSCRKLNIPRKSIDVGRTDDTTRSNMSATKLIEDRSREHSSANPVVGDRKSNEGRRKDDFAESTVRKLVENRSRENVTHQKSMHDQKRESPAHLGVAKKSVENCREDLIHSECSARKLIADQSREHQATNLICRGQKSYEGRQKDDPTHSEFNASKSIGNRGKEEPDHPKNLHGQSQESPAALKFAGKKSNGGRQKEGLENHKSMENQRQEGPPGVAGRKFNEDHRREIITAQSEVNSQKSITDQKKENPAHPKIAAKQPTNNELAAKKMISNRKRDSDVAKLGGKKSAVDPVKGNLLDPKRGGRKPMENRRSGDSANSSQSVIENQVLSTSHVEGGYPVEGQMKAVDILAQYGVYATPYKLLNGDKCTFPGFKLVSPIADTPDHLKALFNVSKVKVSPIPMINERRALDGFNSPVKKPVKPLEAAKDVPVRANEDRVEEPPKKILADDSNTSVGPSPSRPLMLNTVTTSPFKNCCIVKVSAEVVNNSAAETVAKEPATVSVTDTINTEHGVFTRKRRAPVIRHIKKAES